MDIFETKYCCTLVSENAVRLFSESVALVFSVHTCMEIQIVQQLKGM